MKRIKLWYPSHVTDPLNLLLDDDIAAALARAGVAAAADPAEAGSLGSGAAISAETAVTISVPEGTRREPRRIIVPAAVAAIAISGGRAAIVAADVVVTPTPPMSASFTAAPAITTLSPVAGSPLTVTWAAVGATSALVELLNASDEVVATLSGATSPAQLTSPSAGQVRARMTLQPGGVSQTSAAVTVGAAAALPAMQTVAFGSKTLKGHGGHPLGYTGAGTLSIAGGNGAGHWGIDSRNHLVPAFTGSTPAATGAHGAVPPAFAGPYTLTITDGTATSTVTVNMLPNAAHTRAVPSGTNADTVSSFQLRTILAFASGASGALVGGDTVWCRTSVLNATSGDYRVRPPVAVAGTGAITIRSEEADAALENGLPCRKHGFKTGQLTIDTSVSGDVFIPWVFKDIWFQRTAGTGLLLKYQSTNSDGTGGLGYGVCQEGCRFENDEALASPELADGLVMRGSPSFAAYTRFCTFNRLGKAVTVGRSVAGGIATGCQVTDNDFTNVYEDCIGERWSETAGSVIERNFATLFFYTSAGHPDFYQHQGNRSGTSMVGPTVRFNIVYRGTVGTGFEGCQLIFLDDTTTGSTLTGVVIENNIGFLNLANGVYLDKTTDPSVRHNTALALINSTSAAGPQLTKIVVDSTKAGTGGTFSRNVVNQKSFSAQVGATDTLNLELAKNLAAYNGALSAYQETGLATREQVIAMAKPVLNGTLKNGDGTYSGALLPDGSWNIGAVYA